MSDRKERRRLADLKTDHFVRVALDHNRVIEFAVLMEKGVQFPAIIISPDNQVIDGRHRREAHLLVGTEEVDVIVRTEVKTVIDIYVEGFKSNDKSALPHTKEDREHVIRKLLELGAPRAKISQMLDVPESLANDWIAKVVAVDKQAAIKRAIRAIANDNISIEEAAKRFRIKVKDVQKALETKSSRVSGYGEIKKNLTNIAKSNSKKLGEQIRRATDAFRDGDMTKEELFDIISHAERLVARSSNNLTDKRNRAVELANGGGASH